MVSLQQVGSYAFIAGVIIAVLAVFAGASLATTITAALVVLGLIVGLLNVTEKETKDFVLMSVALVIVSAQGAALLAAVPEIGTMLSTILLNIVTFVVPSTVVVSLVAIRKIAQV